MGDIFGGKKWYQSLTGISIMLLALVQAAETLGLVAPGTSVLATQPGTGERDVVDQAAAIAGQLAVIGSVLGLRRAVNRPPT